MSRIDRIRRAALVRRAHKAEADRAEDAAAQRLDRDAAGAVPGSMLHDRAHHPGAGEAELAAGGPLRALVDDAADRVRIGGVADPVQHDLSDGALAVLGFAARLVIDGFGQALDRPFEGLRVTARLEGLGHVAGQGRGADQGREQGEARDTGITHCEFRPFSFRAGFYGGNLGKRLMPGRMVVPYF